MAITMVLLMDGDFSYTVLSTKSGGWSWKRRQCWHYAWNPCSWVGKSTMLHGLLGFLWNKRKLSLSIHTSLVNSQGYPHHKCYSMDSQICLTKPLNKRIRGIQVALVSCESFELGPGSGMQKSQLKLLCSMILPDMWGIDTEDKEEGWSLEMEDKNVASLSLSDADIYV